MFRHSLQNNLLPENPGHDILSSFPEFTGRPQITGTGSDKSFKKCHWSLRGKKDPAIKLSAHTVQDKTIIEVEDNGKGIPSVVDDNMFCTIFHYQGEGIRDRTQPFRQIIRMHGGNIDYFSVPGEKDIFTIKL